jgi:hypothetical protein
MWHGEYDVKTISKKIWKSANHKNLNKIFNCYVNWEMKKTRAHDPQFANLQQRVLVVKTYWWKVYSRDTESNSTSAST